MSTAAPSATPAVAPASAPAAAPAPPGIVVAVAVFAAAAPTLLAYNVSPSPTFLNQALALLGWGLFAALSAPARPGRGTVPVLAALALLAAGVVVSWGPGALPASLALSALGLLAAAAVLFAAGAGSRARPDAAALFAAFGWAYAATALLNVPIAVLQVFAPALPDGDWLAASGFPGRAVGNLRQPNHLSSVLLWGCIALVALAELGRLPRRAAAACGAALVFAVVLTASRTGLVSVLLLACWGALDRRLARGTRAALLAAPLVYALSWWGMAQWAAATAGTFGGAARLAGTDISASRFGIWANTLSLIAQQPWAGTGFGEFNLAWTLTPFPGRPTAFFDHTHNLPLQLWVELGLPLGTLVIGLLLWGLWRSVVAAWGRPAAAMPAPLNVAQRCAVMLVLMIGLHSQLEYPLWYAYFLLPTAWAWGFASGGAPARGARPSWPLAGAALGVALGALVATADYRRVTAVFSTAAADRPLAQRIADGRRSVFHAHHADYAAVTTGIDTRDVSRDFARATHYLLDTRLMIAWARALAESGQLDAARHLAARLREFRKPDAQGFFDECAARRPDDRPFQCEPAARVVPWREFVAPD